MVQMINQTAGYVPDEERRLLAQQMGISEAELSAMMIREGADNVYGIAPEDYRNANRDLSADEDRLSEQMAYAKELMGAELGSGGRTVGPSDIYVADTAGAIAGGIQRAIGGQLRQRALEDDKAFDAEREAVTRGKQARDDAIYGAERDLAERTLTQKADIAALDRESRERVAQSKNESALTLSSNKLAHERALKDGKFKWVTMQNADDPSAPSVSGWRNELTGGLFEDDGRGTPSETRIAIPTGYVDFSSGTGGTTAAGAERAGILEAAKQDGRLALEGAKQEGRIGLEGVQQEGREALEGIKQEDREELARLNSELSAGRSLTEDQRKRQQELENMALKAYRGSRDEVRTAPSEIMQIDSILGNPLIRSYAGTLGSSEGVNVPVISQWLANMGLAEDSGEKQALESDIINVQQGPILDYLKVVAPASEAEYRVAEAPTPGLDDLPYAHVNYHAANTFRDLSDAHDYAVRDARKLGEEEYMAAVDQRDTDLSAMAKTIIQGAIDYGYSYENLERYGLLDHLDKEVREALRAQLNLRSR